MGAEFLAELPEMAGRVTRNIRQPPLRILFSSVKRPNSFHVALGKPGDSRDIVSRVNLRAIAAEIFDDVSAIAEVIHNVAEIPSMREPERVS